MDNQNYLSNITKQFYHSKIHTSVFCIKNGGITTALSPFFLTSIQLCFIFFHFSIDLVNIPILPIYTLSSNNRLYYRLYLTYLTQTVFAYHCLRTEQIKNGGRPLRIPVIWQSFDIGLPVFSFIIILTGV